MKHFTIAFLLFGASVCLAEGKVTARTMEYLDKVHDYALELSVAKNARQTAVLDHALLRDDCDVVKRLVRKGHEPTVTWRGCTANVLAAETRIRELTVAVEGLERNHEIWTVRLAAETGDPSDVKRLAQLYVSKWEKALSLITAQIDNAVSRARMAEEGYEWAKRMRKKGYNYEVDHQKAINVHIAAQNEVTLQNLRKEQMAQSLREAQANLAKLQRP